MKAITLAATLFSLSLTACQTTDPTLKSAYHGVGEGSRLTLRQPVEIAPNSATVRFQYGRIVTAFQIQEFDTYCILQSNVVKDAPQRVEPDTFVITRIQRYSDFVSAGARPGFVRVDTGGDTGSTRWYYKTEMRLQSSRQPEMRALTCQHAWLDGSDFRYQRPPTVSEMQQALGNYFSLEIPGGPSIAGRTEI